MKWLYTCYDSDFLPHQIMADSKKDAKYKLLRQGKYVIKIKTQAYLGLNSFNQNELLMITKQLAVLLKAGLPIVESLSLLAKEHPKAHWQCLLSELKQNIMTGDLLSRSLQIYPDVFPSLYREIIATGELTGQLESSFKQAATQMESSLRLKKRIKKALRYPIFLITVSMMIMLAMLLIVLPKFAKTYADFGASLPYFTQCLIDVSTYLIRHWHIFLLSIGSAFLAYHYWLKKRYRSVIDRLLLHMPMTGNVIKSSCLAQIFQTLSNTLQAGIPLLIGLSASRNIMENRLYQTAIIRISQQIEIGNAFSYAILHESVQHGLFPNLCYQLIRAGEESGSLEMMLANLACYFQEQNEEMSDNLAKQIEPIVMTLLSVIIGGFVIAIYLPIFKLGEIIH